MALVHDVGTHRRRCRLTMRTSHTQSFVLAGQRAQHLCTFLYLKTVLTEVNEFFVVSGDGRGIDDQTAILLTAGMRNLVDILFIVDEHTFLLQLARQSAGSLVVTGNNQTTLDEVTGDGTHTDATGTYKINSFNIFDIHYSSRIFYFSHYPFYFSASLMTSLAMMSAESGSAIFRIFSLRLFSFAASCTVSMAMGNSNFSASRSLT